MTQGESYRDIFSDGHQNREPIVLEDTTSILWPAGWSKIEAYAWRKTRCLHPSQSEALKVMTDLAKSGDLKHLDVLHDHC